MVLDVLGAGGVGQSLKTAWDLFQYPTAGSIILAVFIVAPAMEWSADRSLARPRARRNQLALL